MKHEAMFTYGECWVVKDNTLRGFEQHVKEIICYDREQAERVALALNRLECDEGHEEG